MRSRHASWRRPSTRHHHPSPRQVQVRLRPPLHRAHHHQGARHRRRSTQLLRQARTRFRCSACLARWDTVNSTTAIHYFSGVMLRVSSDSRCQPRAQVRFTLLVLATATIRFLMRIWILEVITLGHLHQKIEFPRFDGENPKIWQQQCETILRCLGFNPVLKLVMLL